MSRRWLLDLDRNVRRLLGIAHGGTGNAEGYATGVVQPFANGSGGTLAIGTVVSLKAAYDDRRVVASPTEDGTDVLGVVVGSYVGDDGVTFQAVAPTEYQMAAVMTAGTCSVTIGSAVTRGEYAYVHATDGEAKSSATVGAGAFGRFLDSASSGSARVALGVFGGGGGGGSIRVKEIDGAPDVSPVTTIRVPNASLTDDGSGQVSIAFPAAGVSDHGDLTGLSDDDHTQYVRKATLTTKGDLYAATAASTPARVGVGSDGQVLTADAASSPGVKWAAIPGGALPSAYVEMTTPRTTTSATLEDITGASLSLVLPTAAHVAVWMNCDTDSDGICDLGLAISLDGTDHDEAHVHLSGSTDAGTAGTVHRTDTPLAAGTYVIKGRFRRINGAPKVPGVQRVDLLAVGLVGPKGDTGATGAPGAGLSHVKEIDGAPDVTGVTLLRVPNGALTDDGGGQITLTFPASERAAGGVGDIHASAPGDAAAAGATGKDADAGHTHAREAKAVSTLTFIIDGGGAVPATGIKVWGVVIDFPCTVTGWTLLSDLSGTATVDVWKDSYANHPPVVGDSMVGAGTKPSIAGPSRKGQSTAPDWSTLTLAAGDVIFINLDAVATCKWLSLSLRVRRDGSA